MAYSDIEQSFMDGIARAYFPGEKAEPAPQPSAEMSAPAADPVQLAAAPGANMTDASPAAAGMVPEIKAYDPTMRERIASSLQQFLEGLGMERSQARKNAQGLIGGPSSGAPLGLGIADVIPFLGTLLQTEEAGRNLEHAATFAKQGDMTNAAIEGAMGAIGLIPGAAGTIKAGKQLLNKAPALKGLPVGASIKDVSGEYRGLHTAPSRGEGSAPGNDLTQIYPDDVYGSMGAQYYGHYGQNDKTDVATIRILRELRGNPDADVTIYRAVPKDLSSPKINPGDWVTVNRNYAKQHGDSVLEGNYKIISKKVKAKDIHTDGNSIHEWGYDPAPMEQK